MKGETRMKEYYSPPQLAEELGIGLRSVQRRLHEMKPYIGTKYPMSLSDGKLVYIRLVDFIDFCNHRKEMA